MAQETNPNPFDIIAESEAGHYTLLASARARQYAAILADSLFYGGRQHYRAVFIRDMTSPRKPALMDVWPESHRGREAYEQATARYYAHYGMPTSEGQQEEAKPQPMKLARPPYYVSSPAEERQWRKWTYDASDEQLLAALRGAGDSWETVPARECRDELKNRGYTLVGAYPHEVELEKPEGQPVAWSQIKSEWDWDQEQAIRDYARLMEAGPLAENEEELQALIEQAYAHGLYFDYDREKGACVLRQGKQRLGIDAADAEEQARQDWSNDE